MAKLIYRANWADPPRPFRKRGDKAEIGKDISAEEAQQLNKQYPAAFQIEGKISGPPKGPSNDRMKRSPGGKRGKANAED